MDSNKKKVFISLAIVILAGLTLMVTVLYLFNTNAGFKELFSGSPATPGAGDTLGIESEEILAQKAEFTGKISMWIFIFITLLQFAAFWVGYAVVSSISSNNDPVRLKLRSLDNAEVFFDVPLYFGLFGTVSAFLVMTLQRRTISLLYI